MCAFIFVCLCGIMCGIVQCKSITSNIFFKQFSYAYVYNVYNFNNGTLFMSRLMNNLLYLNLFFFLPKIRRAKYFTLIFSFIKCLFIGVYCVLLVSINLFSGVIVLLLVFIPMSLLSIGLCFYLAEYGCCLELRFVNFLPCILALLDSLLFLVLLNLLFRVVVVII